MVDLLKTPPTRSALLELRRQLEQAHQGCELLKRKQEVLTRELFVLLDEAERTEVETRQRFDAAYTALMEVRMRMGADRLRWAALAPAAAIRTEVQLRSIMGVPVPLVNMDVKSLPMPYAPGDTSAALDEARERWVEVATILARWVEASTTVWRLATELQKTQRQVNALEDVLIPQFEATIAHINIVLEEHERESFANAKRVKARRDINLHT